jgi:2-hydroxy-3-keto-5-methylthiopentenyl-1-phosphate phosphatase
MHKKIPYRRNVYFVNQIYVKVQYRHGNLHDKIIFIGDGDNDVCAALRLDKTDYVFAKYDEASKKVYKMYDMLKNQYFQQLKAELLTWKTMKDVHEILKKKNIL